MANFADMTPEAWIEDLEAVLFSEFGLRPGGVAASTRGLVYAGFGIAARVDADAPDAVAVTVFDGRDSADAPEAVPERVFHGRLADDPRIIGLEIERFIKTHAG